MEPRLEGRSERAGKARARVGAIAVLGNPNTGKTTIFNRLTGLSQKVGNYPGVTVEKKLGICRSGRQELTLIDLPGTYSLAAHSPDEMVAVDVLLGHQQGVARPSGLLQIVDASNLERNLYLLSQALEIGLPVVVALNMTDLAAHRGVDVDAAALSSRLGVPVVPVQGNKGIGLDALRAALFQLVDGLEAEQEAGRDGGLQERQATACEAEVGGCQHRSRGRTGPACLVIPRSDVVHELSWQLHAEWAEPFRARAGRELHIFEVLRSLVDEGGNGEARLLAVLGESGRARLAEARDKARSGGLPLAALEAKARYAWVRERLEGVVQRQPSRGTTWSERLDGVLTHKVLGLIVFAAVMILLFRSIFVWAAPLMDLFEGAFTALGGGVERLLPEGALRSLIVDGVIAGVGMVVIFLPQILILFLFIGLLEDCGYMARAAFLMDRVMQKCGLSGKSFIPLLSGFACAVPGILATRVIENRKDRIATILVTPLMSCSARLPVYSIFIGTFLPERSYLGGLIGLRSLTLFGLYAFGIVLAVGMAWLFRKSILRGPRAPFVLELPSYKLPSARNVVLRLLDRAQAFLARAGTAILAISVVVWALAYFPRSAEVIERFAHERSRLEAVAVQEPGRAAELAALDRLEEGEHLRGSYFGRMGHAVEPVFAPLGWDWRISMAVLASFPAREVVVSTLGTIFNLGGGATEESVELRESLRAARRDEPGDARRGGADEGGAIGAGVEAPVGAGRSGKGGGGPPLFTIPVALSILVFFALCCQCGATVVTIKRETNSWGWALFAFVYMTVLAYIFAWGAYEVGSLVAGEGSVA